MSTANRFVCGTLVVAASAPFAVGQAQNILPNAVQKGTVRIDLQPVASGFVAPVFGTSAPGDTSDLFIVDQAGKIDIVHNGTLQPTPFLDISSIENAVPLKPGYDERGLLGLAFSPGFNDPKSPGFHTLYTYQSEAVGTAKADAGPLASSITGPLDHQNVLVQWKVSASNPNVVDPASRRDLFREDHPELNHNGGTIAFGPDGMLYLGIGDGGAANDVGNGHVADTGNAQNVNVPEGKILRFDVNGTNSANGKYGIPADNPFANGGGLKEIYAYGFRNPYRFSFDNGKLLVADVGQNQVEELDSVVKGGNYGWAVKEGTFLFNRTGANAGTVDPNNSPGSPAGLIDPLLEYDHNAGTAIVGGFVYHGALMPQLDGKYIFGDFSNGPFSGPPNGRLFYADLTSGKINEFILGDQDKPLGLWLKGFGEDANGEIYVMTSTALGPSGTTGEVFEIVPEPATVGLLALIGPLALRRRR